MSGIVFIILAVAIVLGAFGVIFFRNVFYGALSLGVTLVAVGGLFPLLGADFLFAVQILLYAGGVAVLLLFVILLSGRAVDRSQRQINDQWLESLLVVLAVAVLIGMSFTKVLWPIREGFQPVPTTRLLGSLLLDDMALPFEAISLVLLAALLGAMMFSRRDR